LRTDRMIWGDVAGTDPAPLFRPPYGELDPTGHAAAEEAGFPDIVLWDVDPEDWKEPGSRVIVDRVLSSVAAGSIVELHATAQTAEAVPHVVAGIRSFGLHPVSLPGLLRWDDHDGSPR
jgi:peptidoglycan-N-acetylglucosamine deacetylase